jgi:hypothetical protein
MGSADLNATFHGPIKKVYNGVYTWGRHAHLRKKTIDWIYSSVRKGQDLFKKFVE